MSPTTSIPVFPISAVIVVTFLDSDPAGCTTLAASLSFISCFGLTCDCAELITFSTLGSAFDPSRYDTTQDRCIPSKPRFAKSDRPATDVRQTRATDAAHNSPAHEAGASRGGTWSTDHELSTHASSQTHEIDLTQSGNSHEKCAIRARVSSTGNICWLGPLLREQRVISMSRNSVYSPDSFTPVAGSRS